MTMRCDIERGGDVGDDGDYRGETSYAAHLAAVPCRLWSEVGRGQVVTTDRTTVVNAWRMNVPQGTDVAEGDRINGVTDRLGVAIESTPLGITQVIRRTGYIHLILEESR